MRRVRIGDIMRETGLSRATVDRVINGREGVHPKTRAIVEDALHRLGTPVDKNSSSESPPIDFVLRVGRGMLRQLQSTIEVEASASTVYDMYQKDEGEMLELVRKLCGDSSRALVLTARNTELMIAELISARQRGKTVVALISDLASDARDAFVGIDNRAAGQAAAFLIGRALGDRPTIVGIVVGDHTYRCHEDREIGFRAALRNLFPKVILGGEAQGEDDPKKTQDAVVRLIKEQPAISAIYNVGGGNLGLFRAVQETGHEKDLMIVAHETNSTTVPILLAGIFDYLIAQDPSALVTESMRQATIAPSRRLRDTTILDFTIHTRFNIPGFGRQPVTP